MIVTFINLVFASKKTIVSPLHIQVHEWCLRKQRLGSSETSVLTRATRRNNPEDTILHSHRRENLKSYIALTGWTL
jgi:hypothetical protein